ncbi:MAG TPA: hypothetical protein VK808_05925 [Bacteroidia bacterium]|jgi:hypothetical protein|nr:hypothetical protein [Bacteroidia bacterium]
MENTTPTPAPKSGGWKVMGIISVVLGGLSILFAFIPCLGMYAMYSGVVAAILSIIALVMANSAKASKMMAIIGLVISVASIGVGYWRYKQIEGALDSTMQKLNDLSDSLKNVK